MDTSLSETELEALEVERADRSIFIQDVLLNTLMISNNDDNGEKVEPKQMVRERSSPMQVSSQLQQQSSQSAISQSSSTDTRSKNGQNEQLTTSKRPQQRTSPNTERTTSSQRMTTPQNRIEYVLSRPHQPSGNISVREVLVGNNYANADTARRKPICTVDSINQTTEPPTSH